MIPSRGTEFKFLLLDACVLIDFIKADRLVLASIIRHVGTLYVISPVVDEVLDIDSEEELAELGIVIVEPETEDAFSAAEGISPNSFQDRLSMFTAKRNGYTCVTNDKNLRRECREEGVPVLWGLQLLIELHKAKGISSSDASRIVSDIHQMNPKHITTQIVERFRSHISGKLSDG